MAIDDFIHKVEADTDAEAAAEETELRLLPVYPSPARKIVDNFDED